MSPSWSGPLGRSENGHQLEMDCCSMYTLRAGKIAELNVLPFDAARWDEFWT